jgi:hypothetical protein
MLSGSTRSTRKASSLSSELMKNGTVRAYSVLLQAAVILASSPGYSQECSPPSAEAFLRKGESHGTVEIGVRNTGECGFFLLPIFDTKSSVITPGPVVTLHVANGANEEVRVQALARDEECEGHALPASFSQFMFLAPGHFVGSTFSLSETWRVGDGQPGVYIASVELSVDVQSWFHYSKNVDEELRGSSMDLILDGRFQSNTIEIEIE